MKKTTSQILVTAEAYYFETTMKESFQLPNEVFCSTGGVSGSVQNALNKKRMAIDGIKKVSVVSTSISRSSKINPVNIESDNGMAAGAKTLTEQATTLRRLKLVCIFLAMSTAIITATFGGLIHTLVSLFLLPFECINFIELRFFSQVDIL